MAREELNFLEFLQGFRRGDLLHEADTQLSELITAVTETGGSGELVLKLPFKVNKAGQLECLPVVAAKKPRRQLGTGIFYATDDGKLTRRDPNQADWLEEQELSGRRARARADAAE